MTLYKFFYGAKKYLKKFFHVFFGINMFCMFCWQLLILICGGFYTLSNNIYYVGVVLIVHTLFNKYIMLTSYLLTTCKWSLNNSCKLNYFKQQIQSFNSSSVKNISAIKI